MNNYGCPIRIGSNNQSELLERVALGHQDEETAYNENWLRNLIFDHPSCLPIKEIDAVYMPMIPLCKEMKTKAGPIDAVFITPEGKLIIVETKLWRNPESRRKVVAQILDYAKELAQWSYDDLLREVSSRTEENISENILYDIVKAHEPELEEADFVDGVEQALQRGQMLLLIVGDGIKKSVQSIVSYLDDITNLDFTLGLTQMAVFKDSRGEMMLCPQVLGRTVTMS